MWPYMCVFSAHSVAHKPGVREVIVVDAGSSDRTVALARASGAKVSLPGGATCRASSQRAELQLYSGVAWDT